MGHLEDSLVPSVRCWLKDRLGYTLVRDNRGQTRNFVLSDPVARKGVEFKEGVWGSGKESTSQPDVVAWEEGAVLKPRIAVELKWANHTSGPLTGLWQACLYLRGFDHVFIGTQLSLNHLKDAYGHTAVPELLSHFGIGYLFVPMKEGVNGWESNGDPEIEITPPKVNKWRQKTIGPFQRRNQWVLQVIPSKKL